MPEVRRTRATLRSAEFGFFGVVVYTRVHTPRRWGAPLSAGVLVLSAFVVRPLRTSCSMVGTRLPRLLSCVLRADEPPQGRRHRAVRGAGECYGPIRSGSTAPPGTT